jgi:tryptophan-rich sensory protein
MAVPTLDEWTPYASIPIVGLSAVIGSAATWAATKSDGWYKDINKSNLTPPNWVFGVVWVVLYILIIIAWIRSTIYSPNYDTYFIITWLFVTNIILTMIWSILFFSVRNFVAALAILLMTIVTGAILIYVIQFDIISFVFIVIYVLWLLYAFILNYYVAIHNRSTM